jgi:hypothetical protein
VPATNRVTPAGEIVAIDLRGRWLGNRGCIHRGTDIVRRWQTRRWITCALSFKGWRAPMWQPGRWTPLFFHDEAVALAAGHRPCALCRRPDYERFRDAWQGAFGARLGADDMDRRLHADRVDGRAPRRHTVPWPAIPAGTFVALAAAQPGETPAEAALVGHDVVVPWTTTGYALDRARPRPTAGNATVLTPACTVAVLRAGYVPDVDPLVIPAGRGTPRDR